jgi:hypothetical protein
VGILRHSAFAVVLCSGLAATGCVQKEFPQEKAQAIVQSGTYHLDAEQVSLTMGQVECGAQNDLWQPPPANLASVQRASAPLLQAARDLHFDDDVVVEEPGFRGPHAQVRGDFMLQIPLDGMNIRENGQDGRTVEGRLGVIISHSCFPDPLPVLGVRKGNFSQDVLPVLQFQLDNDGWHFTKLVH